MSFCPFLVSEVYLEPCVLSVVPQETVDLPEVQVFDRKLGLNDACGFDSGSKHILLIREVVRGCNPV